MRRAAIWCVATDHAGRFESARVRSTGTDASSRAAWSVGDWLQLDPDAARQFIEPDEARLRLQQAFIRAAGLGDRARIAALMADSLART